MEYSLINKSIPAIDKAEFDILPGAIRWLYRREYNDLTSEYLDLMGADGWELCCVFVKNFGTQAVNVCIWKRPDTSCADRGDELEGWVG